MKRINKKTGNREGAQNGMEINTENG